MMRDLIDTDWIISYLHGFPRVVRRLGQLKDQGRAIPVVSLAELYEGIGSCRRPSTRHP